MNLTPTAPATAPATAKAQEAESDYTPPLPPPPLPAPLTQLPRPTADNQTPKALSLTNGVLKRIHHPRPISPVIPVPVVYRECQKNHAASLGGHALDGCGEFMPSPSATLTDPTSLKCAACGCHRNFHRREPEEDLLSLDFPHHHHHHYHLPLPSSIAARGRSPNSPSSSPPPLSSSYYPSAPHMLLALSTRYSVPSDPHQAVAATTMTTAATGNPDGRKRFRTKFNQEQKEKMFAFSEKLGWKMQKSDKELIEDFCNEIGVEKSVLKVWMHNNKHSSAKRENASNNNGSGSGFDGIQNQNQSLGFHTHTGSPQLVTANASSSSS